MLNIFNVYTKNTKKIYPTRIECSNYYKYFPVSTREWNNSIYVFNKNTLGLIPQSTISAINIINGYFNIYNSKIERNMRITRLLTRFRRLSSHKTYVSNGEFKHTNNKVIITLYIYNRQNYNYLSVLKTIRSSLFCNEKNKKKLTKEFYLIKNKGFILLKKADKEKYILIKNLYKFSKNKNIMDKYKSHYINDYLIKFYKKWLKNNLKQIKTYLYYKQLSYINESKYNYTYLQTLKNFIQKIYNKKIEFNLINLKYHYLNSDIFSESITLKITRNRRKLLIFLYKLIRTVKIYKKNKNVYYQPNLNKLNPVKNIKDSIESILYNSSRPDVKHLKKTVLDEIKYKRLSGVRLEASGRLNKRYTASRSVSKLRYKGNLINLDSSYKGLSTVILKGNLRSNLQYSKLKSKTRIGSFGIKSWVSGN